MSRIRPSYVLGAFFVCASVAFAQSASDARQQLDAAFKTGLELRQQGKLAEAVASLERAAELAPKVFGAEHMNTAGILSTLGTTCLNGRQPRQAETHLRRSLAIREKNLGPDHFDLYVVLDNLALACAEQQKFGEQIGLLKRSLALQEKKLGVEHPDLLTTCTSLAGALNADRKHDEAITQSRRIVRLREKQVGADHSEVAEALQLLAVSLQGARQLADAEAALRRAVAIHDKAQKKDAGSARPLAALASHVRGGGRLREAEPLLRRAVEMSEASVGKDHPQTAVHLYDLGELLMELRDYDTADRLLRRALGIFETKLGADHHRVALCLSEISAVHDHLGQFDEAESACRRALKIAEKSLGAGHFQVAAITNRLAGFLRVQGKYAEAETLFLHALKMHETAFGADSRGVATLLNNLAQVQKLQGRIHDARRNYLESLRIQEKHFGKDHPTQTFVLNNLGTLSLALGEYKEAEAYLQRSLALNDSLRGRGVDAAVMLEALAVACHLTGQHEQALRHQAECLEVHQKHLGNILALTSEASLHSYLETVAHRLPMMVNLVRGQADSDAARTAGLTWTLRFKGIAFDASCRYRAGQHALGTDSPLARRAAEYRDLKQKLADAALHPVANEQLAQWQKASQELEIELKRAMSKDSDNVPAGDAVSVKSVRDRLEPRAALVEFVRVPTFQFKMGTWSTPRYVAFVLRPGQDAPSFVDLGEEKAIVEAVVAVRDAFTNFQEKLAECEDEDGVRTLEKTQEPRFRKIAAAACTRIFAPFAKAVSDAELVYLAPDADLNRLPFGALVDEAGKYLAETRRFAYLSSGRDLLRPSVSHAEGTLVFAGPDYKIGGAERAALAEKLLAKKATQVAARGAGTLRSVGWKALPGAAAEAKDVRTQLEGTSYGPVRTHEGPAALEEVLKAAPAPRILHLATHGFFLDHEPAAPVPDEAAGAGGARGRLKRSDNPLLRSGIVLAGANTIGDADGDPRADDGWVTAEEIALLQLRGTELVVLSACQTGLGDVRNGEGVYGLRRAFLYAGARTLVASLFEVPDIQTRELMRHFYKRLRAGESKLAALSLAQRDLIRHRRETHEAAHPFFWASFILVGDPK